MFLMAVFAIVLSFSQNAEACTGITLRTISGSTVTARTIEWAGNDLESKYSIVPRGYSQRSFTPDGKKDGMMFTAKYGYVDLPSSRLSLWLKASMRLGWLLVSSISQGMGNTRPTMMPIRRRR